MFPMGSAMWVPIDKTAMDGQLYTLAWNNEDKSFCTVVGRFDSGCQRWMMFDNSRSWRKDVFTHYAPAPPKGGPFRGL